MYKCHERSNDLRTLYAVWPLAGAVPPPVGEAGDLVGGLDASVLVVLEELPGLARVADGVQEVDGVVLLGVPAHHEGGRGHGLVGGGVDALGPHARVKLRK